MNVDLGLLILRVAIGGIVLAHGLLKIGWPIAMMGKGMAARRVTGWVGTFIIDGFLAGQWRVDRRKDGATIVLEPFGPLGDSQRGELLEEAERLLAFSADDAGDRRVEFGVARARRL